MAHCERCVAMYPSFGLLVNCVDFLLSLRADGGPDVLVFEVGAFSCPPFAVIWALSLLDDPVARQHCYTVQSDGPQR